MLKKEYYYKKRIGSLCEIEKGGLKLTLDIQL